MDTNNLLRQHQEMLDLADKICTYQNQQQVKDNAADISSLLSQLAGKLSMHLMVEDKFVYPKLAVHHDMHIKNTAQFFAKEMGDLGKAFGEYKAKYMGANKVAENAGMFIAETKIIFAALSKRMDKENRLLYPLLSK